jgi:hypothetical protein
MSKLYYILVFIFPLLFACGGNKTQPSKPVNKDSVTVVVPEFNADTAFNYVKEQVDFGPRVNNTAPHEKCAAFLSDELQKYCDTVIVQKGVVTAYNGASLKIKNIIGTFNPLASYRILLCSHWDSRPYADYDKDPANHNKPVPGANDGASGVGVLLELARIMALNKIQIGVDIIFLDAEDYGEPKGFIGPQKDESWGLGTQFWAKNPHVMNYKANYGILLDMVGVKNPRFAYEGLSLQYAPDILEKVWNMAQQLGYSSAFIKEKDHPINDDHNFINQITGIPTIDIIHLDQNTQTGFYEFWHTTHDDLQQVDKLSLKMVGQTLTALLYNESEKFKPSTAVSKAE